MYDTSDPDSKHEKEMLQNILTLSDTTVEEIMTHRSNIFSINIDDEINNIIENISNSKFTRIPVWKNIPENIIGVLDSRSIISSKYSTNSLTKKYNAVELVKLGSKLIGGTGGGGRPDFAQSGGNQIDFIEKSFEAIKKSIK